jgi:hypothetical protein
VEDPVTKNPKVLIAISLMVVLSMATTPVGTAQNAPQAKAFLVNILYENGAFQYDVNDGTSTVRTPRFSVHRGDRVFFTSSVGRFAVLFTSNSPLARLTYEGGWGEVVGGTVRADAAIGAYKYDVTLEVAPGEFRYEDPDMDVTP